MSGYTGVVITNLIVQESPAWLRNRLSSIGVRPINNVVDVTNFVLHETGQPLHAFDLSKIAGGKIVVQTLKEGSLFVTLDEQERELSSTDLMICNGLSEGMCIGGVFGGIHTGVTERTQSIFLESAHFHPAWIRRTSDRHNLYTDASRTFEKGSDPNICLYALKRAAMLLEELAGGRVSSEVKDIYPSPILPAQIRLEFSHLNRLVGKDIVPDKIKGILSAMNMQILDVDESGLLVGVPTDKADVQREVDLIEEVLRIYGFNNIPMPSQMSISVTTTERPDPLQVRNRVADYLVSQGCNEMMGMSMVDNRYFENTFQLAESELVRINNTSNVQVEVMRPSMLISALEAVLHNQNRQQTNLRLFEFGYSYRKGEAGFDEKHHLTITSTSWEQESWHNDGQRPGHTFYALKSLVESVLAMLGVDSWHTEQMSDEWHVYGLQYENKGGTRIVTVGKVAETICSQLDIRSDVYYAEFDWNHLMMSSTIDKVEVKSVSKYPTVRRDMALVVDKSTAFDVIRSILLKGQKEVREVNLFDVFEDAKVIGEGKKSYAISLVFGDETKTLSDKEVDKSMAALVERCQQDLGAKLR
ncbi:MAG: phenylalanine--tRNA ligase subunit beta [Saprospiraceae bacterium]|nr:phenylalanine--tRNA ligase subunit beta [Saprospiraceae bacterium]